MRYTINKKQSTKAERIMYEILKELHINFKHRWVLHGREIDFVIDKYCIEINGHEQDHSKNELLVKEGFVPLHFNNSELYNNREQIKQIIKNLW